MEGHGLIKSERKCEQFIWKWSREVGIEANIDNQSKSLLYTCTVTFSEKGEEFGRLRFA